MANIRDIKKGSLSYLKLKDKKDRVNELPRCPPTLVSAPLTSIIYSLGNNRLIHLLILHDE